MRVAFKKCSGENGCGEYFPVTSEYFHKNSKSLDGFQVTCKKCLVRYNSKRYLKNKKTIDEQNARYSSNPKNKQRKREYSAGYRDKNKDKIREKAAKHRAEHREEETEYHRRYASKNKLRKKDACKRYRTKNRDKITAKYRTKRKLCLTKLGHKCVWEECGITQSEFLAFDHINDGGAEHRKKEKSIVDWFVRENFPEGVLQLLCHNHNNLKELARQRFNLSQNYHAVATRKSNAKLRLEVFTEYGPACACCGQSNLDCLTIDHSNGGGRKHLKSLGLKGGIQFHRWLKKMGFPAGYRTLCCNCNMARGFYGYCPHNGSPTVIERGQLLKPDLVEIKA